MTTLPVGSITDSWPVLRRLFPQTSITFVLVWIKIMPEEWRTADWSSFHEHKQTILKRPSCGGGQIHEDLWRRQTVFFNTNKKYMRRRFRWNTWNRCLLWQNYLALWKIHKYINNWLLRRFLSWTGYEVKTKSSIWDASSYSVNSAVAERGSETHFSVKAIWGQPRENYRLLFYRQRPELEKMSAGSQCVCESLMWFQMCLLDNMNGGAERSVVLQPVQERSHPLRQRSLQLRNVTLGIKEEKLDISNTVLAAVVSSSWMHNGNTRVCR